MNKKTRRPERGVHPPMADLVCTEISRAKLLEPTGVAFGRKVVWSHPAYANKCGFFRNDKEIICVLLAAE